MTSIHTNTGSMAALTTLRSISGSLDRTQQQASSGLRIETSADNAAYWSIATTMRSDNLAKSAVSDSLGLGQAVLDTTYTGMDQVREELTAIRNLVLAASDLPPPPTNGTSNWWGYEPDDIYEGSPVAKIDLEIGQRFQQIASIVNSSSFSGINLLKNELTEPQLPGAQVEFVAGFANGKVQTVSIDMSATVMINYNRTGDTLDGAPGSENQGFLDGIWMSDQTAYPLTYFSPTTLKVEDTKNTYFLRNDEVGIAIGGNNRRDSYDLKIQQIDDKLRAIINGMATVGAMQKRLANMDDLNNAIMDTVTKGVGGLVDADMNETSTRIKALQTQQQLSTQALSIANAAPETIMQLFR